MIATIVANNSPLLAMFDGKICECGAEATIAVVDEEENITFFCREHAPDAIFVDGFKEWWKNGND